MNEYDEAYREGGQAYLDGVERDESPYARWSKLYPCWDWGWTDKRDEVKTRGLLEEADDYMLTDDERESA